ncbi:MAG: DUF4398 domain-containing protein [Nitrosomonas sp. PRO4]|nr:DUF4398 domain-containing protein [Nitrosomonas sp. PRO4]
MYTSFLRNLLLTFCFVSIILLISACNSIPKPVGELASAKAQIETAETNDANHFAPVELDRAKTKLNEAEKAADEKNYATAKRLADESLSDGKLATAKASAARAQKSAQDMRDTIQTMGQELERVQRY